MSLSSGRRRGACLEEFCTALDIILVAAANLRHYRDRLTPDDHTAAVRDIEQAAEQIARRLKEEALLARPAASGPNRRTR